MRIGNISIMVKQLHRYLLLVTMTTLAQLSPITASGAGSETSPGQGAPTPITLTTVTEPTEPIELTPTEKMEQIRAQKEAFVKELEYSEKALERATADGREATVLQLAVDLLQRTDLMYGQQIAALRRKIELDHSKAQLEESLMMLRTSGPSEKRPYSFLLLDSLRDELTSESARIENLGDALGSARDNLEHDREILEGKEKLLRQSKEELNTNQDEENTAELDSAVSGVTLRSKFAEQKVMLRRLELANQKTVIENHNLRLTFLAEKIEMVAPEASFTQADLKNQLEEISEKELRLEASVKDARETLGWRERKLLEVRQRLDASIIATPAHIEELETWQLAHQSKQVEVSLLTKELVRLSEMTQLWNNRFRFANGNYERRDLSRWVNERNLALEQLARDERLQESRLADLRRDLLTIDNRIRAKDQLEPGTLLLVEGKRKYLNHIIGIHQRDLASIETQRRLEEKFLSELGIVTSTVSISEWGAIAWEYLKKIWVIELTHIDDQPITIGKVLLSVVFFIIGIVIA